MNHEIKTLSKNKLVVEFENDFETIEVKYKINSIQCTKDVFDPGSLYGHDNVFTGKFCIEELEWSSNKMSEKDFMKNFKNKEEYFSKLDTILKEVEEDYIEQRWRN